MRKISIDAARAFVNGRNFQRDNTRVVVHYNRTSLYLFGNKIAEQSSHGMLITNARYPTVTTRYHLNALPNVNIHQMKGLWFLNDSLWDGRWARVSESSGFSTASGSSTAVGLYAVKIDF